MSSIKTKAVVLAWTNNLHSPDNQYKHSSGAKMYSVSMVFDTPSLQDFKVKITTQVGEQFAKAMYVKEVEDGKYQVKAKCVEYFENAQGKTYQKPYIKDMQGNDISTNIEGLKAIVEVQPKAYPQYKKLGLILKGVQLVEEVEQTVDKAELEKAMWGNFNAENKQKFAEIQDNYDPLDTRGHD